MEFLGLRAAVAQRGRTGGEPPGLTRPRRRRRFLRELTVFVSSPGDLPAEREAVEDLVDELGKTPQIAARFALRPRRWEEGAPSMLGSKVQLIIDRFLGAAADGDIVVVLIGRRLGTPLVDPRSGRPYSSGTQFELDTAYESYQHKGKPLLLVYRYENDRAASDPIDQDERDRVQAFWSGFNDRYEGVNPKSFSSAAGLQVLLRQDLSLVIDAIDTGNRRRKLVWLIAGSALGIALGWLTHVGYERRQVRLAVNRTVDAALESDMPEGSLDIAWSPVTDALVALGPAAVRPILARLPDPRLYEGKNHELRADQSPTRALVAALAEQGKKGERDAVCEGLFKVLRSGDDAVRYPKSTHRIAIKDGIARVNCPGAGPALCDYLGHLRSDTFMPPSNVFIDLAEAASPPLRPDVAKGCL